MTFINKIRYSDEYRRILKNLFNFTLFQLSNYLIPLITIPYIIRVVGVEKFGIISLAQAVSYYFRIVVEYGFPISGVQYVAQNQAHSKKLSEIYYNIIFVQILLMIGGLIILFILSHYINFIKNEKFVFFAAYGIVPANIAMALWFFIGSEKMKYLNYINFTGRILYIVLILTLIHEAQDYRLVPVINSVSMIIAGIISYYIIRYKFQLRILKPTPKLVIKYISEGWSLFVANFAINFYRNTNIIILGFFASKDVVGIYSAVEKIIKIIQTIFSPLTRTLYPYISRISHISKKEAFHKIIKILQIMAIFSFIITLILIAAAPKVIKLVIGESNDLAIKLIWIGSFVIFLGVLNYILGIIYMTNFGLKKQFSRSVVIVGVANVVICIILTKYWKAIGTITSFTGAELLLFILLIITIKRNYKWNILNQSL